MAAAATGARTPRALIDIGCNLTDPMFSGVYRGKTKHQPDLDTVLARAWEAGLTRIIITGGNLEESEAALALAKSDERLFCTVGCHPTRCNELEEGEGDAYLDALRQLIVDNRDKVVAVGECGLDYDRLEFCEADVQKKWFEKQLELAAEVKMPLFLHSRASGPDMQEIMERHIDNLAGGVVHSFDGSIDEMIDLVGLGLYIGINGCSLKTEENLETVKAIPLNRLMLETDAPWCGIRPSHAGGKLFESTWPQVNKPEKWAEGSTVKGRCEPCHMHQVLEVVASARGDDVDEVAAAATANTEALFVFTAA